MSKRGGSSIRKKIVHGYLRMYCFFSFVLLLIFFAAAYTVAFYIANQYISDDMEKAVHAVAELAESGLGAEEIYENAEGIFPDYLVRYDVSVTQEKVKEEDYYNQNYYQNLSEDGSITINIFDGEVTVPTEVPTYTPAPDANEGTSEATADVYDEADLIRGYVTSTNLYLRQRPDIDSDIIYKTSYGDELYIVEDLGEWYKIYYEENEVYAASKFISLNAEAPTPTPGWGEEFWQTETYNLFSKSGTQTSTFSQYQDIQKGNAFYSLKEPYLIYAQRGFETYDETTSDGYVLWKYYTVYAVADVTKIIPYYTIWSSVTILLVFAFVLFFAGFLLVWIYGAAKTKKYLKPINEITELASRIQPNSQYRLNVNTAKYELKELVITINSMLDRLSDAHVKRKKFVSDVSHELRTPISVVAGYANMLKRWAKEDEAVFDESVDAIIEEADNMKYLVENLLFLARSDNDQNLYDMEAFDISSLICSICKDAQMVDKGKHNIVCDVEEGVIINGDRNRIKQALREFLQNSIKYTPPMGEINMTLKKLSDNAIIEIKDTGMGISQKDMGHIFTRFYRGDVSRNRDKGGYGLGLAICREIISAHKGKITFKSKEGAGTIVTVTLNIQ